MWKFVGAYTEQDCKIFGVNVFDYKWVSLDEEIEVRDPIYNEAHILGLYNVKIGEANFKFAAGEFSNGVYGFYEEVL